MRRFSSVILYILLSCSFALGAGERVLYIASYHPGFPTFTEQVNGIQDIFAPHDITLDIEFMDTKRISGKENWEIFRSYLAYKLENVPPYDLFIIADDNALLFALEEQERIFRDKPIIFLGVNNVERALAQNENPQITGVIEAISLKETIELMGSLQPEAKEIAVIVDGTPSGQGDLKSFWELQKDFSHHLTQLSLMNNSWEEMQKKLQKKGNSTALLLLSAYRDSTGETVPFEEGVKRIKEATALPVFHLWRHGIGEGLLGGKVISHYNQGQEAARMALQVLGGRDISSMKVMDKSPNQYLFDYRELQRHGISLKNLPETSMILNKPYSFYEENRGFIWGIIITFLTLFSLLISALGNLFQRKKTEVALRASEERISLLTKNMPSVMLYQLEIYPDGSRAFTYVSENVKDINQVTAQEVLDDVMVLYKQIDPDYQQHLADLENEALEKMETFFCEAPFILPNGEKKWFQLASTPQLKKDGTVLWHGVEIDITKRKKAESERQNLSEQLHQNQKMEAVGQLAGGVAHDFNNSLAAIMGAAELLKREELPPKEQEFIDMIITASDRAGDLTKKLLTFSRQGAKVSSVVNCAEIVSDTVALLKHTIDKAIIISIENRAVQTTVVGDNTLLQNAFMNIGINASHAMEDGGTLTFTLENLELDEEYCEVSPFEVRAGDYLEIAIRDTGCGMPPEVMSRIFEPFYTTKGKGKGTGLGLSAVYGAIQEHGGAITVYSEVGEGTVFHIYLPTTTETVKREVTDENIPAGSGTILVIDDEKLIRATAAALLKSMGYTVVLAENGLEGVNVFRDLANQVDLIILDMIMPVMNGREAFVKLREIRADVPIIISSGFAKDEHLAELKKQGVSGFLCKPFRKVELAEAIQMAISPKL